MPKKQIWSSISRKEDKPWGHTFVWNANGNVQGKIITILAGKRTSLKYKFSMLFLAQLRLFLAIRSLLHIQIVVRM